MLAHNLVQVDCLWRGVAERFSYSAFYVEEEWRVQRFINTVKLDSNLADSVVMPRIRTGGAKEACFCPLVLHLLGL